MRRVIILKISKLYLLPLVVLSEAASASLYALFACITGPEGGRFRCGSIKKLMDNGISSREVTIFLLRKKRFAVKGSCSPLFTLVMRTARLVAGADLAP
jgi:hypothetical protein